MSLNLIFPIIISLIIILKLVFQLFPDQLTQLTFFNKTQNLKVNPKLFIKNKNNSNNSNNSNNVTEIVHKRQKMTSFFDYIQENSIEAITLQNLKDIIKTFLFSKNITNDVELLIYKITMYSPEIIRTTEIYKVLDEDSLPQRLHPFISPNYQDFQSIKDIYKTLKKFCETLGKYEQDTYKAIGLSELGIKEIYVVNLKERPERLKNIQNIFKNDLNLNFTLFHAFYGKSMEKLLSQNKKIPNLSSESKMNYSLVKHEVKAFNETWNKVGCSQSHLHILFDIRDKAINGNDKPVLILEDDIEFHPKFKIKLKEVYKFIPDDWEILACGHCYTKWGFLSDTFETGNNYFNLVKVTDYLCTHGYIIRNANVAKKIISQLNVGNLVIVDVVIQQMVINKQLNVYAIVPELIRQNKEKYGSDISGDPVKEIVQNDEESELEL